MKLTKGTVLRARGGWDAEVVWIHGYGFYAIHQPDKDVSASAPISHGPDGKAHSMFSVMEPPCYAVGHPADLEMGDYKL